MSSSIGNLRRILTPFIESEASILRNPENFASASKYLATRYPIPLTELDSFKKIAQWTQNDQLIDTIALGSGDGGGSSPILPNVVHLISDMLKKLENFLDIILKWFLSESVQSALWTSIKIGTTVLIITVGVYGARFVYLTLQQHSQATQSARVAQRQMEEMILSSYCVVCHENEKTHLIQPCGHFSLCGSCINNMVTGDPCPMCRVAMTQFQRVFY